VSANERPDQAEVCPIGGQLSSRWAGRDRSVSPLSAEAGEVWELGGADVIILRLKKQQQSSSLLPLKAT